jgi:hypothetical protein
MIGKGARPLVFWWEWEIDVMAANTILHMHVDTIHRFAVIGICTVTPTRQTVLHTLSLKYTCRDRKT